MPSSRPIPLDDLPTRPARTLIGDALDDPEPDASRQARTAGQHANPRAWHVFVNSGNPNCYHNAELDVSGPPDNVTFGDLQRRMLCSVCDHRGGLRLRPNLPHSGSTGLCNVDQYFPNETTHTADITAPRLAVIGD